MMRIFALPRILMIVALVTSLIAPQAFGQDRPAPLDMLELSASASSEVAADIAVVTLSAVRDGTDIAMLTQEVDAALTRALADAKTVQGITAFSGGYSTQAKMDKGQPVGWQVHGDLIVKSHDFVALGKLIGRLTSSAAGLQISNTAFEVSPELRQNEENDLINRAIAAFKNKASVASKALGYSGFAIHQVTVGSINTQPGPHPMFLARNAIASVSAQAMPLEAGRVILQIDVSGSVQMRH